MVEYGQADYSLNDLFALQWLLYPVMAKYNISNSAISQKENKVLISLVDDTYKNDLIDFIKNNKINMNEFEFIKNSPRDVNLNADYAGRSILDQVNGYTATIGFNGYKQTQIIRYDFFATDCIGMSGDSGGPIGTEYGLNMGSKMLDLLGITATGTTYGTDPTVYYIKGCKATNIYGAIANLYMP